MLHLNAKEVVLLMQGQLIACEVLIIDDKRDAKLRRLGGQTSCGLCSYSLVS